MGLSVKQGTIAAKTGTTGSQATTGVGFQPKLVFFFATAQTAAGFADDGSGSFGAATSATEERCIAYSSDDNVSTSDTARRQTQGVITILGAPATPTILAEADMTSLDADGFTLNWSTVHATDAYLIHYLALGGSDISNAKVGAFTLPNAAPPQTVAVTGVGFQPDCVLQFGLADDAALGTTGLAHGHFCFGAAMSSSARWLSCYRNKDGVTTTEQSRYQRSALCFAELTTAGAVRMEADFVSMDADGFTMNQTTSPAQNDRVFYIALKGAQIAVGVDTASLTATTKKTTLAFQPSAVLLVSDGNIANVSPVVSGGAMSIGSGTAASARGSVWTGGADNVTTTNEAANTATDAILKFCAAPSTTNSSADLASLDADGFTLNWTVSAGVATEFGYFAIGALPTVAGPSPGSLSLLGVGR